MMERKYYNDIDYKPFLFYVVFGVSEDNMQVSKTKHHVDEVPAGIDVMCLNRTNNNDYIENFFRGAIGDIIKERNEELYNICREQDKCVVIQGAAIEDATFDYMRNIVGVMQAFVDNGAVGILDLLTFTLFSPKAYTEKFFEKDINAQDHVVILISKTGDKYWLHTRGMSKFGRPDISMENVAESNVPLCKNIINQMIYYGGEGAVFKEQIKINLSSEESYIVNTEFINDFDNDDFNNAYYKISL